MDHWGRTKIYVCVCARDEEEWKTGKEGGRKGRRRVVGKGGRRGETDMKGEGERWTDLEDEKICVLETRRKRRKERREGKGYERRVGEVEHWGGGKGIVC